MTLAEQKHGDYLQFHTDNRRNGYIMTYDVTQLRHLHARRN